MKLTLEQLENAGYVFETDILSGKQVLKKIGSAFEEDENGLHGATVE